MSPPPPPHVLLQERLDAIAATLERLAQQDPGAALTALTATLRTELRGYGALTAELHGEVTALSPLVQQQAAHLDRLYHALVAWQQLRRGRLLWGAGGGVAVGVLVTGLAWGLWPSTGPAAHRLLTGVDQVLVQQWRGLPKGVQEHLTAVYGRAGVVDPGRRHGKETKE